MTLGIAFSVPQRDELEDTIAADHRAGKRRYRQIAVVEKEQFEVRIFEGEVLQLEPQFAAKNSYAEVYLHPTLEAAITDAEKEFKEGADGGWQPYHADRV